MVIECPGLNYLLNYLIYPEPEPVAVTTPVSNAAKPSWNFDPDGPRTTGAATAEKRSRLSPEERAAQVEFIRSLNR